MTATHTYRFWRDSMHIQLHGVNRVLVEEVEQIHDTDGHRCVLQINGNCGTVEVALFADKAGKLDIIKVENINDYQEPAS